MTITARKVPDSDRMDTLPKHFGSLCLKVEMAVYDWMDRLSDDYNGGHWNFFELDNGGFYMAPSFDLIGNTLTAQPEGKRFKVSMPTNGYEGQMSTDAAGITATLFALSHLSFEHGGNEERADMLATKFHALRDFASEHAEAAAIFEAID